MTDKTESAAKITEVTAVEQPKEPQVETAQIADNTESAEQKIADKKTDDSQITPPAKQSNGRGLAWFSLLIALIATGASAYLFWQTQHWSNQINQVDNELAQITSEQTSLNQLENKIREQQTQQLRQFEQGLQSKLQAFSTNLSQSQQETYANQQAKLTTLLNQVKQNSQTNKNKLLLNDVSYLVKQAHYKLVLEKNPKAALLAMQLAADNLQQNNAAQYMELSAAINQDIGQLTELAKQQNEDLYLALAQIIGQVRLLPILTNKLEEINQTQADLKPTTETSWQNLAIIWHDFLELFTPKKRNEHVEALLTPEQSRNVELNLMSVLHQAQWAALNNNQPVLSTALKQAANWLNIYYQTNDIRVMDSIDKLNKLSEQDITGNFDSVELTSLELVAKNHD